MRMWLSLFTLIFVASCSCSKEEKTYGSTEMWSMAQAVDPTIELVPITDPEKRVLCENYEMSGCMDGSGKRIKISKVEMLTIQYETVEQARAAAFKIDQWYAGNWLFDDVTNEPVLESFVKKAFNAQRPAAKLTE